LQHDRDWVLSKAGPPVAFASLLRRSRSAHHDCEHPCLILCPDTSTSTQRSSLAHYRQYQHSRRPPNARNQIFLFHRPSSAFAALFHQCSRDDREHPCSTPYHDISALGKGTIAGTLQAELTIAAFTICSQLESSICKPRSSFTTLSPQCSRDNPECLCSICPLEIATLAGATIVGMLQAVQTLAAPAGSQHTRSPSSKCHTSLRPCHNMSATTTFPKQLWALLLKAFACECQRSVPMPAHCAINQRSVLNFLPLPKDHSHDF
jgi:hypothetical protein